MRCTRCGRKLTREPVQGMGPVCLRATTGAKPKRVRLFEVRRHAGPDENQPDLFLEARP